MAFLSYMEYRIVGVIASLLCINLVVWVRVLMRNTKIVIHIFFTVLCKKLMIFKQCMCALNVEQSQHAFNESI